jgi:hypothetical protein
MRTVMAWQLAEGDRLGDGGIVTGVRAVGRDGVRFQVDDGRDVSMPEDRLVRVVGHAEVDRVALRAVWADMDANLAPTLSGNCRPEV